MKTIGFLMLALAVGATVGASVALLYAPQSGRVTRATLHTKGLQLQERIGDGYKMTRNQVVQKIDDLANEVQTTAQNLEGKVKETVGSISLPVHANNR